MKHIRMYMGELSSALNNMSMLNIKICAKGKTFLILTILVKMRLPDVWPLATAAAILLSKRRLWMLGSDMLQFAMLKNLWKVLVLLSCY